MTEEEQKKHARCYELQDLLEPLYVFSSKLKHLQLAHNSLEKIISEIEQVMKVNNSDNYEVEYYVMQFERFVLEILSNIFGIRDCLKNLKLVELEDNFIVKLHNPDTSYMEAKHTKILNETLLFKNNKKIVQLTYRCRNKLLHERLQDTKFRTYHFLPKYDNDKLQVIIGCDFYHFMYLLNLENKEKNLNYYDLIDYFIDDHVMELKEMIIDVDIFGEHTNHIKGTLNKLGKEYYLEKYYKNLKNYKPSTLILFNDSALEHIRSYKHACLCDFQDELLKDSEYVFFLYETYLISKKENKGLRDHHFRFNMSKFIEDSYNVNLTYYLQLHSLLKADCYEPIIIEYEALQREIGIEEVKINECKKRYSAETPEKPSNKNNVN